jgi:hypothetical protein
MENRFVTIKLDAALLKEAKASSELKKRRGELCNISRCHKPLAGRARAFWTGSVGEVALARYLRECNDSGYEILTPDDPSQFEEADVVANGHYIDAKARAARYGVHTRYWMFVERASAERDVDYFVFCWYNYVDQTVTLLGFLERDVLLQVARLFHKGERLDNGWSIPCESYGVRIDELENIDILPVLLRENGRVRAATRESVTV